MRNIFFSILSFLFLMIGTKSLEAKEKKTQPIKHQFELSVGDGYLAPNLFNLFYNRDRDFAVYANMREDYYPTGTTDKYMPIFNFGYFYEINTHMQIGIKLSYWRGNEFRKIRKFDDITEDIISIHNNMNGFFVEGQYKYYYYRFRRIALFAKLTSGLILASHQVHVLDTDRKSDRALKAVLNLYAAPIGIEFGSNIGVYLNGGWGFTHFADLGLYYRF